MLVTKLKFCKNITQNLGKQNLSEFKWFLPFQTRWLDNDINGHIKDTAYYEIFDSVIDIFLIRHCGLQIGKSSKIGFVASYSLFQVNLDSAKVS